MDPSTTASRAIGALLALLAAAAAACGKGASIPARAAVPVDEQEGAPLAARHNVDAARELDQQGVRSFRDGRYADAIRFFRAAFRLGGPSSELWNVARSLEKVDDGEAADAAITEYLRRRDLSPQDRGDAEREQLALRARPSTLAITTTPSGALVTIDGKPAPGPAPLSIDVAPGAHTVVVRQGAHRTEVRAFEARFGRAVIVALDLAPAGK
jgi:PEGA domain